MGWALGDNAQHLEQLYKQWLHNPESVDREWAAFFSGIEFAGHQKLSTEYRTRDLVRAYRSYGYLAANTNPLVKAHPVPELSPERYGFSSDQLDQMVPSEGFMLDALVPLGQLLDALKTTYCGTVGFEYMGTNSAIEEFIQRQIEPSWACAVLAPEMHWRLYQSVARAETFESFLQKRFPGAKRFSLEGSEVAIPMLVLLYEEASRLGVKRSVLGMSHRGRLNIIHTLLGRSASMLFREFSEAYHESSDGRSGDVKYHRGYSASIETLSGIVEVDLLPNPSHLESVNPVVEGFARALQTAPTNDTARSVLPVVIHGDAAISGQGVVYETLQMMRLPGYGTEGSIHIVLNNQIGFTTLPRDGRSTALPTDIAKAFNCPVFHVNADDPEACVRAAQLAVRVRQQFGCDVFIDVIGYRRYGHNEGDEPAFTQPLMYSHIRNHQTSKQIIAARVLSEKIVTTDELAAFDDSVHLELQQAFEVGEPLAATTVMELDQNPAQPRPSIKLSKELLLKLAVQLTRLPPDLHCHPKVQKLLQERHNQLDSKLDWAWAETLAFASLVVEGVNIRLAGQDVGRGTFSQRHALIIDQQTEAEYFPLQHLSSALGRFTCVNSLLSEYAALGFEYGYSLAEPACLCLWEAQFGDFANGAQIIIDQYIAAGEMKWGHSSRLSLLLPHGYEGQGPEHSSARLERYLQLAAEANMSICVPSNPAQYFHLLRRQAHLEHPKPLIILTPKGLLRLPAARSTLDALSQGAFQPLMMYRQAPNCKKLILCYGKIVYELLSAVNDETTVVVSVEELYPIPPLHELVERLQPREIVWVQDEPANQGAWEFMRKHLPTSCRLASRPAAASTAVGSMAMHKKQQQEIISKALQEGIQ